jgi:hypothetical protein
MICWIASYPKSGNTWLRALISAYYYSKDGIFDDSLLRQIDQFPTTRYFSSFEYDNKKVGSTCEFWIPAQEKINIDKKLKFFKTHNAFGKINDYDFTNSKNSIACLYIVRDPRNIFTSIKNHYQLDDDQAIKWISNEKNFIYDVHNFDECGYSDFQFIGSWNMNYRSWRIQKKIPIKLIKYEDMIDQTYAIFCEVIKFVNKLTNNNEIINKTKLRNVLKSTSFETLKKNEIDKGFKEAVPTRENKDKKIPFFNLGPKNNWKEILSEDLKVKLDKIFEKELRELGYI